MKLSKRPELQEIIDRLRDKARRKVPDSDAEDLVQEVLVVLVERIQRNLPIDSLQAYADGVLRHVIYDYYQRKRELLLPNDTVMDQPSHTPTPEQRVVWMRHLRVIEQLAEENRIDHSLMKDHFIGGAPLREVANQLDVSPGVVNGRLYRFRQKLMKHTGSCFAWVLALLTGLWDRIAHASNLPRTPQAALGTLGLVAVGTFAVLLFGGDSTPKTSVTTTSASRSITAATHSNLLLHIKEAHTQETQRLTRQKLTLQWDKQAASTKATIKATSQYTLLAPHKTEVAQRLLTLEHKINSLKNRTFHGVKINPSLRHAVLASANIKGANRGSQLKPHNPTHQKVLDGLGQQNATAQTSPTKPSTQAKAAQAKPAQHNVAPSVATQPSVAIGGLAKAPTQAVRPNVAPQANNTKPSPIRVATAQASPKPITVAPSMPTPRTPSIPSTAVASRVGVLTTQGRLQAVGAATMGSSIPHAKNAPTFTATARHSFCMVNDGRVYRCDSGKMADISGTANEAFGCQSAPCRGMIGDGPSLLMTQTGEIFIVGPRHFRVSKDDGVTWGTPDKSVTPTKLLSQASLILNQQGELWQSQQQKWQQVRSSQPGVHEVRVHLDKGRLQVEDDAGFRFKQDWKAPTTTSPKVIDSLSSKVDVRKVSPTVNHKAPSITDTKPGNSTPLPPQKDAPILSNP